MRVIEGPVPIYAWSRSLAPETIKQFRFLAAQPFVVDRVAAMPDAHVAEGVAVGSVFATEHALVPAAIGGDIGCGMAALRFEYLAGQLDRQALEKILVELARAIPVGHEEHRRPRDVPPAELSTRALQRSYERIAPRQLGTLGAGNHFLELERDAGGFLWVVVHSGSRGVGSAIAAHHRRAAETFAKGAALPWLDAREESGRAYLADLAVASRFARANREAMLSAAAELLSAWTGIAPAWEERVEVEHNFISAEVHGGRALLIHRKGATAARSGELGIVPGSMGTATYLVRGHGAAESFGSCSHGAGRVMTRGEARRKIKPAALERMMRRVVFDRGRLTSLVEESPAAYRDIREVLEDQAELVSPVLRLEPIAVLKG